MCRNSIIDHQLDHEFIAYWNDVIDNAIEEARKEVKDNEHYKWSVR
jgi:hypothetical protein